MNFRKMDQTKGHNPPAQPPGEVWSGGAPRHWGSPHWLLVLGGLHSKALQGGPGPSAWQPPVREMVLWMGSERTEPKGPRGAVTPSQLRENAGGGDASLWGKSPDVQRGRTHTLHTHVHTQVHPGVQSPQERVSTAQGQATGGMCHSSLWSRGPCCSLGPLEASPAAGVGRGVGRAPKQGCCLVLPWPWAPLPQGGSNAKSHTLALFLREPESQQGLPRRCLSCWGQDAFMHRNSCPGSSGERSVHSVFPSDRRCWGPGGTVPSLSCGTDWLEAGLRVQLPIRAAIVARSLSSSPAWWPLALTRVQGSGNGPPFLPGTVQTCLHRSGGSLPGGQ